MTVSPSIRKMFGRGWRAALVIAAAATYVLMSRFAKLRNAPA